MIPVLIIFVLVHIACVIPGIKPSNSYGMMLDGFPVKDFTDKRYFAYIILTLIIELRYGLGGAFLALSSAAFIVCAAIGGWALFYSLPLVTAPLLTGLVTAYIQHQVLTGALLVLLLLFTHVASNTLADDPYIHARYKRWILASVRHYKQVYGDLLPSTGTFSDAVLSLMFIEDRSRPTITRIVEYARGIVLKSRHSYGIMQVQSDVPISSRMSIKRALPIIAPYIPKNNKKLTNKDIQKLAVRWNGNIDYSVLLAYVYGVISNKNRK